MSEREEFEEWCGLTSVRHPFEIDTAWQAWQAARASRWRSMESAPDNLLVEMAFVSEFGLISTTGTSNNWIVRQEIGKDQSALCWRPFGGNMPTKEELEKLK